MFFADLASTKKSSQSPSAKKLKGESAFETPAKKRKVVKDEEEYRDFEVKEEETPIRVKAIKRVRKEKVAASIKVEA